MTILHKSISCSLFLILLLSLTTIAYSEELTVSEDATILETPLEKPEPEVLKKTNNNKVGSVGQYIYEVTTAIASGSTVNTIDAIEELWNESALLTSDLQMVVTQLRQNTTGNMSLNATLSLLLLIFPLAFGFEKITRYLLTRYFASKSIEGENSESNRLSSALRRLFILCGQIMLYSLIAVLLFNLIHGDDATTIIRAIFYSALSMILLARAISCITHIYLRTEHGLSDQGRNQVLKGFMLIVWVNCLALFIGVCLKHLGVSKGSTELFIICSSTFKVLAIVFVLFYFYRNISSFFCRYFKCKERSEIIACQLSRVWFIPTIIYLIVIWAFQVNSIYYHSNIEKGAYFTSLLAMPLYFVFVRIGSWIVQTVIRGLQIYRPDHDEDEGTCRIKEQVLIAKICNYVHPVMLFGLVIWVLKKWGYELPFISERADAVLNITITVAITLLTWHLITSAIEKKLKSNESDERLEDDEWGADSAQGREYTLLPVLRKCIGAVLALIAVLTCLSSLGVNIAPILAGAGVLGIAIGFGSQKVVSDILSGFFFLMDDAFRVGEFIEAGSIKGRVEEITLRNVLLRHHRGMLQIVPFSELGSVTNYMRGGIVEKFNLEFPYDTDVDKVRKVIKKVGQAMLEDEEYGEDFIRPLKSQGVREISNSVMTIRAKFTAKPGRHFVIRREAYRRVTEALNGKGLYYAHRKVIVEMPENTEDLKGGLEKSTAAAALSIEQDEQTNLATSSSKI